MIRIVYTLRGCGYTDRVIDELDRLGLEYKEVPVEYPISARKEVRKVSGQARVPVLVDDGEVIIGSDHIVAHLRRTYQGIRY